MSEAAPSTREFLAFLRLIDREVPAELEVPPRAGQLCDAQARQGQAVAGCAAALPLALHAHLLVLVEPGGAVVRPAQPAGDRGGVRFRSVTDLVNKIEALIDNYNASATPFVWVATAQSIIDKVARIAMRISGKGTSPLESRGPASG